MGASLLAVAKSIYYIYTNKSSGVLSRFHALRVAPKTIGHEVKAVCVKLIKHLTILKKHERLFCRSRKRGIRLHTLGVYSCLSVVI